MNFLAPKVFGIIFLREQGKVVALRELGSKSASLEASLIKTDANLKEEVLNCRLACLKWNQAINLCLERLVMTGNTAFVENIFNKSGFLKPYAWQSQRFCFYFEPEKAIQFVQTFEASHFLKNRKNPFLGRFVHIEITLDPINEEVDFVLAVESILRMFGHQIWFASLSVTSKRKSIGVNDYLKLREYIELLPNLRYFFVRFNTFEARNLTATIISQNPIPKLEHLLALELGDINGLVLNHIVSQNSHAQYYGMHVQLDLGEPKVDGFSDLKGFSATCVGQSNNILVSWVSQRYKLGILQIQQRCIDFDMNINFQYLNSYLSDTLVDLTLELTFPTDQRQMLENSKNLRLNLPRLRRLMIQFSGIHYIDFVFPLQNLEIFELLLIPKEFVTNYEIYKNIIASEQLIDFVGFEKRMHESNIWHHLVKLKKLKINFSESQLCYEYTRKF